MKEQNAIAKHWKDEKTKGRVWAFVAYPESAPENWREILQQTGLEFAISPLHDSDKDPTDEEKKPHWHIIAVWSSGTATGATARRMTESINAPLPQPVSSIKGYYRYLTHKDNPDKHQYDESEITAINGFSIANHSELTRNEVNEIKKQVQRLIISEGIEEYSDLLDYLLENNLNVEWDVSSSHTLMFNAYLTSRRHVSESRFVRTKFGTVEVDPKTGEVLTSAREIEYEKPPEVGTEIEMDV